MRRERGLKSSPTDDSSAVMRRPSTSSRLPSSMEHVSSDSSRLCPWSSASGFFQIDDRATGLAGKLQTPAFLSALEAHLLRLQGSGVHVDGRRRHEGCRDNGLALPSALKNGEMRSSGRFLNELSTRRGPHPPHRCLRMPAVGDHHR